VGVFVIPALVVVPAQAGISERVAGVADRGPRVKPGMTTVRVARDSAGICERMVGEVDRRSRVKPGMTAVGVVPIRTHTSTPRPPSSTPSA
jgi:hypothetical protein